MGFEKPDGKPFRIPVSDTQSYRQFGNSVWCRYLKPLPDCWNLIF
ncbi:hypothetical protein [Pantoea agglomerans]|nr:hypothetical protein [Pantoea agglomerans]WHU90684.1 hypothetical protein A7P62_23685 [Pantoea agglomerans pv. gypsophilae]